MSEHAHRIAQMTFPPPLHAPPATRSSVVRSIVDTHANEIAVLRLLAEGLSSREIGAARGLSTSGVDRLRCKVMFKLGARNPAHAVAIGIRKGLLK